MNVSALQFDIIAECNVSKARVSKLKLPHYHVDTPIFMPVGTQGTIKGLTSQQLENLNVQILLGNTYHLSQRPGEDLIDQMGGLHKFMNWKRGILTDSGGFQMVSLLDLAVITEQGVTFQSPHDGTEKVCKNKRLFELILQQQTKPLFFLIINFIFTAAANSRRIHFYTK